MKTKMGAEESKEEIYICNRCGAVSTGAREKCPQCGADRAAGWNRCARDMPLKTAAETARRGAEAGFFRRLLMGAGRMPFGLYRLLRGAALKQEAPNARYQRLLQMAQGNKALVHRMIEAERKRNPDAGYDQLLADAIYRWEREFR